MKEEYTQKVKIKTTNNSVKKIKGYHNHQKIVDSIQKRPHQIHQPQHKYKERNQANEIHIYPVLIMDFQGKNYFW